MKKLLVLLCSGLFFLSACDGNKTPEQEEAEAKGELPNISLFISSCESTDSLLCNPDSCVATDCGIEDYYFTLKGNVVQRVSCLGEEDALWVIGKYRVGDSGIVCQMDKVYMVSLKPGPDGTVNYNKGEYVNLENKEPHLLARSACKGILYTKRYSETQLTELRQRRESAPFGRIYSQKKDREEVMVAELKKVKVLADL
ncbi:MAG: hypothetical protein JWQ38_600 [Flavipsychrobacter sp.]|nr:hypothetical protein [Flavipsychrobacter sp.]